MDNKFLYETNEAVDQILGEGRGGYFIISSKEAMKISEESLKNLLKAVNFSLGLSYAKIENEGELKKRYKIVNEMKLKLKSDGREVWLDTL